MGSYRDELTRRALRAAGEIARAHGLACEDPELLADGANVLAWLRPTPVVARIATMTGLVRAGSWGAFCREVSVAGYLADVGVPVVRPAQELPPGPHTCDGLTVTFWQRVKIVDGETPGPAEFGAMLREMHQALAGYPERLPYLVTPLDDIAALLADRLPGLPGTERASLGAELAELTAAVTERSGRAQTVHGDVHPGNMLPTPDGWLWNDFEDACASPVEWDLACVLRSGRLDGRAVVAGYGRDPDDPDITLFRDLRRLHGGLWMRLMRAHA